MFDLAQHLVDQCGLEPKNWVKLELGIEKMKTFFGIKGGYCLNVSVSGYGRNKDEAWATHEHGSRCLIDVVSYVSAC